MAKTLIVIDMQNDFIDGALGTPEAQAIVPNVKKKIEEYKTRGDKVVFTRDTHDENYLSTMEGKFLPVKHCIKDTHGWEISKEIDTSTADCFTADCIIDKPNFGYVGWVDYLSTFNCVENEEDWLGSYLIEEYPEAIELVGLCTDICVVSNALILKAIYPEVDITVDASCCAGVTPESHKAALTTMKMCQVNVIGE